MNQSEERTVTFHSCRWTGIFFFIQCISEITAKKLGSLEQKEIEWNVHSNSNNQKTPAMPYHYSNYNLIGIVIKYKAKINLKLKLLKAVYEDYC